MASNVNTVHTTQNDCPYILSSVTTEPFPDLCERSVTELRKLQLEDDTVGLLLKAVEDQQHPPSSVSQGKSRKFQLLLQQWNQLYVNGGFLFRRYEDCQGNEQYAQLVLPESLTAKVLNSLHSGVAGGHLGEENTFRAIARKVLLARPYRGCPQMVSTMPTMCTEENPGPQEQSKTNQY